MCGLVGTVGPTPDYRQRKAFRDMLFMDAIRGNDSTGMSVLRSDKSITTVKNTGVPSELMKGDLVTKKDLKLINKNSLLIKPNDIHAVIGHNRAATIGSVNVETAHPYDFKQLVGAHNGTLTGGFYNFDGYDFLNTDSYALYNEMNKRLTGEWTTEGRTEAISSVIKDVDGAMALTFYDKVTDKFHIYRNSQRPLKWVLLKQGYLAYASEEWMIYGSFFANQVLDPVSFRKKDHVFDVDINTLYTLDPFANNYKDLICKEKKVTKYTSYSYGSYRPTTNNNDEPVNMGNRAGNFHTRQDKEVFEDVALIVESVDEKNKKFILTDLNRSAIRVFIWYRDEESKTSHAGSLYQYIKDELNTEGNSEMFFRATIVPYTGSSKKAQPIKNSGDPRPVFYAVPQEVKPVRWQQIKSEDWDITGKPFGNFIDEWEEFYKTDVDDLDNVLPFNNNNNVSTTKEEHKCCGYCGDTVDMSKRHVVLTTDKSIICNECLDNEWETISQFIPPHLMASA